MSYPYREPTLFTQQGPYNYPELPLAGGGHGYSSSTGGGSNLPTNGPYNLPAGALYPVYDGQGQARLAEASNAALYDAPNAAPQTLELQHQPTAVSLDRGQAKPPLKIIPEKKKFNRGPPPTAFSDMVHFIRELYVRDNKLSGEGAYFIEKEWYRHRVRSSGVGYLSTSTIMWMLSNNFQFFCWICGYNLSPKNSVHCRSGPHRAEIAAALGIPDEGVPCTANMYCCRVPGCFVRSV